jgi:hypothetical protein
MHRLRIKVLKFFLRSVTGFNLIVALYLIWTGVSNIGQDKGIFVLVATGLAFLNSSLIIYFLYRLAFHFVEGLQDEVTFDVPRTKRK